MGELYYTTSHWHSRLLSLPFSTDSSQRGMPCVITAAATQLAFTYIAENGCHSEVSLLHGPRKRAPTGPSRA